MKRVLITGATGFIGKTLIEVLSAAGYRVRAAVRCLPNEQVDGIEYFECGGINAQTNWTEGVQDVSAIVHLADRPDAMENTAVNTNGKPQGSVAATLNLADAAISAAVKKFIYMSSIKVNGENSGASPYLADREPRPENDYALAKRDTERALLQLSAALEVVVIRPPLVYGPGAGGNFALLKRAIASGMPLPFASIHNVRSLVSVFNLCDFVKVCLEADTVDREIFLVSDGHDLSTPELIRMLASAMRKQARLFHFPCLLLRFLFRFIGKQDIVDRLCGNLQLSIDKNKHLLGWTPPFTVKDSLRMSVTDIDV